MMVKPVWLNYENIVKRIIKSAIVSTIYLSIL